MYNVIHFLLTPDKSASRCLRRIVAENAARIGVMVGINEVMVEGLIILHIYVPESSQVHRCNGRIFDRNEDGDFDITDHTRLVSALYHRKQATYSENKIYPYAGLADLRTDLIAKSRRLAGVFREDHPWSPPSTVLA